MGHEIEIGDQRAWSPVGIKNLLHVHSSWSAYSDTGPQKEYYLSVFITPPTSMNQSRHSIDVMWRHSLSPRYTHRQKSVTGIHWNAYYWLNRGCRRDKFVIRYVTDVLRTQSRFVKCVGGSACGLTPPTHKFYKPTLGPNYVRNRPYN